MNIHAYLNRVLRKIRWLPFCFIRVVYWDFQNRIQYMFHDQLVEVGQLWENNITWKAGFLLDLEYKEWT